MPAKRGADTDSLFQLPLAEFTGARNALAARLKKEGKALDAERVKALAKPSAPAWAVNQLYWQDPDAIEQLLETGERLRKAQTGQAKNVDLRRLLDEKKKMMAALLANAESILGDPSPDAMRRVSATLEALAAWGNTDGAPKAGRLTADLDPPGFDTLAALMTGNKAAAKVLLFQRNTAAVPAPDPAAARKREAVQAAEKTLENARREAERAEAALARANARYAEAKETLRAATSEAKRTAQAVADAERTLAKAKR